MKRLKYKKTGQQKTFSIITFSIAETNAKKIHNVTFKPTFIWIEVLYLKFKDYSVVMLQAVGGGWRSFIVLLIFFLCMTFLPEGGGESGFIMYVSCLS